MSNLGKWDDWYKNLSPATPSAFRYADTVTYLIAAAFTADMEEVEDWGCGAGGFKRFCRGRYIGIDGSKTPFADKIVDLCAYTSSVDGIVIRHVLEHNYNWTEILKNAMKSFRRKLCVVLFTPFAPPEGTTEITHNREHGVDVPDLALPRALIEEQFAGCEFVLYDNLPTPAGYGVEHVYLVWRNAVPPPASLR
jgi:hypothetical protein